MDVRICVLTEADGVGDKTEFHSLVEGKAALDHLFPPRDHSRREGYTSAPRRVAVFLGGSLTLVIGCMLVQKNDYSQDHLHHSARRLAAVANDDVYHLGALLRTEEGLWSSKVFLEADLDYPLGAQFFSRPYGLALRKAFERPIVCSGLWTF